MAPEPASILASETRILESHTTGRTYRITISLPYGYSKAPHAPWLFNELPAQWHTVYLLDANWLFGMVTDTVRLMSWCGSTADAIIVGIGYPEVDDPLEVFRRADAARSIDFTPVRSETYEQAEVSRTQRPTPTGDADRFHTFLKTELIPVIERDYRASPSHRILMGASLGGLFTAFALLQEPALFATYIAGSPALWYGEQCIFKQEEMYARLHTELPANLFLYAGELEESAGNTLLTSMLRFSAILRSRNYTGLVLTQRIFSDLSHCEVIAPGFQAGLKVALKK